MVAEQLYAATPGSTGSTELQSLTQPVGTGVRYVGQSQKRMYTTFPIDLYTRCMRHCEGLLFMLNDGAPLRTHVDMLVWANASAAINEMLLKLRARVESTIRPSRAPDVREVSRLLEMSLGIRIDQLW